MRRAVKIRNLTNYIFMVSDDETNKACSTVPVDRTGA